MNSEYAASGVQARMCPIFEVAIGPRARRIERMEQLRSRVVSKTRRTLYKGREKIAVHLRSSPVRVR